MGVVILNKSHSIKPQNSIIVNWGHPLAQGLVWAALPGADQRRETVTGGLATLTTSGSYIGSSRLGSAVDSSSTTNGGVYYPWTDKLLSVTSNYTLVVWARPDAKASFSHLLCIPYHSTWSSPFASFRLSQFNNDGTITMSQSIGGTLYNAVTSGVYLAAGDPLTFYGVTVSGGQVVRYFINGVFKETVSFSISGAVDWGDKREVVLLNRNAGDLGEGLDGITPYAAIWNRTFSDAEMMRIYTKPFDIFYSPKKIFASPASTDLSINVSDSITITENVDPELVSFISKSETVTLTENTDPELISFVSKTDSISLTENLIIKLENYINKTENITVTESVNTFITPLYITVSDSISLIENTDPELVSFINKSETITLSENTDPELISFISVSDSITVSESIDTDLESFISKNDTVTLTESVSILIPTLLISVSDSITLTENTDPELVSFISKSETVTLTETTNISNILQVDAESFSYIQSKQTASGATSALANIFSSPTIQYDLVTVFIKHTTSSATVVSVTDNAGNTYVRAAGPQVDSLGITTHQFYGVQETGGATTITVTMSTSVAIRVIIDEYRGGKKTTDTIFDKSSFGTGAGTSGAVASFLPATPGELITAGYAVDTISSPVAGTNYTIASTGTLAVSEYRLIGSSPETAPLSWTGNVTWNALASAFFPGGSNDRITVTENVSVRLESQITASDTITVTDTPIVLLPEIGMSVSDSITITENVDPELVSFINVSDSVTIAENSVISFVGDGDLSISVSDSISLTESTVMLETSFISVYDSINLTEQKDVTIEIALTVSESITITENVSNHVAFVSSVSDSITISETIDVELVSFIHTTDTVSLTENKQLDIPIGVTTTDTITITESNSLLIDELYITVNNSVSVSENMVMQGPTSLLQVSDSVSVTEALTMFTDVLHVAVSDTVTVTQQIIFQPEYFKNQPFYYDIGQGLSVMIGPPRSAIWGTNGRPQTPRLGEWGYNDELRQIELWNGEFWEVYRGTRLEGQPYSRETITITENVSLSIV